MPTRREFLRTSTLAAGALALPSLVRAAEPIDRSAGPKFKFSLAAYSYRDWLTGEQPKLTLLDFIDDCAKFGLEGTELTSYYFPPSPSDEYLARLKHAAFRLGLDISGTAVGNDFCHPAGEARDQQIADVKRWIERAHKLGAPVIRVFSGTAREGQLFDEAFKLCVAAFEETCDYAGRHGVFLALENHGGLSTRIDDLLKIVKAVKSDWFGVNLDTGNFQGNATAEDAYAAMAQMAPHALNVQVKVKVALKDGQHPDTDFARLAKILRESGYRGYVVLEYEEADDPRDACPKHLDQLRAAFA